VGVGFITLPTIGVFLLPLGIALALYGARRVGWTGLWAAACGGAVPSLLLFRAIATVLPPCSRFTSLPPGRMCGEVPAVWHTWAVLFAGVAGLGVVVGGAIAVARLRLLPLRHA
jgi:hypothetical protein